MKQEGIREELLDLLYALDGLQQDPYHHPEGDALYHSLQVFEIAIHQTNAPKLWAVALLHDIGKAEDITTHAGIGADALDGLLSGRLVASFDNTEQDVQEFLTLAQEVILSAVTVTRCAAESNK